jgi:hypothetical protein
MIPSRRAVRLALVILAVGVVGTGLVLFFEEPSFRGKLLSGWLAEFNRIPPGQPAPEAEQAIRSMGPAAVPYLLSYIWSAEPQQVSVARQWVNRTFHRSYRSRTDLCAPSWRALSILGPAATSALPAIVQHAVHGPLQGRAMIALAVLGTNSMPALIDLCGQSDRGVRVEAAFLLAKAAVNMPGLESFIATSGTSGQPMLAYNIREGLQDLEPLAANLRHPNPAVRRASVEAMGSDAELRRLAEPRIRECLQDLDPSVRAAAATILKPIPSGSTAAEP